MPSVFQSPWAKESKVFLSDDFFLEDVFSQFQLNRNIPLFWNKLKRKGLHLPQIVKFFCEKIPHIEASAQEKIVLQEHLLEYWWNVALIDKAIDEKAQSVLEVIEALKISEEVKVFFKESALLKWWFKLSTVSPYHATNQMITLINLFSLTEMEKNALKIFLLERWRAEELRPKSELVPMITLMNLSLYDTVLLQTVFIKEWWEQFIFCEIPFSSYILHELWDISKMPYEEREKNIQAQRLINLIKSFNETKFLIETILVHLLKEISQTAQSLATQEQMQIILLRQYGMQLKPQVYLKKTLSLLEFIPLSEESKKALKDNLFVESWRRFFQLQEPFMSIEKLSEIWSKIDLDKKNKELFQKALLNYWLLVGLRSASENILKLYLSDQALALKLLEQLWKHLRSNDFSPYKIINLISQYWRNETPYLEGLYTFLLRQWWPQFEFSNFATYLFFVEKMQFIETSIEKSLIIEEMEGSRDSFSIKRTEAIQKDESIEKTKVLESNLLIRAKKESQCIDLLKKWAVELKASGFCTISVFKEIMIELSRIPFSEESKRNLQIELINQLWDDIDEPLKPLLSFACQLFKFINSIHLPLKEKDFLITQLKIRYQKELADCVRRLSFSEDSMDELDEEQITHVLPEEAVSASQVNELELDGRQVLPWSTVVVLGEIKESGFCITQAALTQQGRDKKEAVTSQSQFFRKGEGNNISPQPVAFFAHLETFLQDCSEVESVDGFSVAM